MKKRLFITAACIAAVAVFAYFLNNNDSESSRQLIPDQILSENEKQELAVPQIYKDETIGFKLETTSLETMRPPVYETYLLDQSLNEEGVYIKAYPLKLWQETESYGDRKSYDAVMSSSDGQPCGDTPIALYGVNLNQSCRIIVSDDGTRLITGFYKNRHGEPPFVAFFVTNSGYGILLIQFYREEFLDISSRDPSVPRFNAGEEFVQRVQAGEFPEISKKIEAFNEMLKTVKSF